MQEDMQPIPQVLQLGQQLLALLVPQFLVPDNPVMHQFLDHFALPLLDASFCQDFHINMRLKKPRVRTCLGSGPRRCLADEFANLPTEWPVPSAVRTDAGGAVDFLVAGQTPRLEAHFCLPSYRSRLTSLDQHPLERGQAAAIPVHEELPGRSVHGVVIHPCRAT